MIISAKKNFLFLHVPKTGGTTVSGALSPHFKNPEETIVLGGKLRIFHRKNGRIVLSPNRRPAGLSDAHWRARLLFPEFLADISARQSEVAFLHKHSNAAELRSFLTKEFYDNCTKFLFVRHPYKRTFSAYSFKLKTSGPQDPLYHRIYPGGNPISFEEFLTSGLCQDVLAARPQHLWHDPDAPNLHVFRTEQINDAMPQIMKDLLGMSDLEIEKTRGILSEGRKNESADPDEWRSMSDESKSIIRQIYRLDFERFGFE